jgi:hypothetical protein
MKHSSQMHFLKNHSHKRKLEILKIHNLERMNNIETHFAFPKIKVKAFWFLIWHWANKSGKVLCIAHRPVSYLYRSQNVVYLCTLTLPKSTCREWIYNELLRRHHKSIFTSLYSSFFIDSSPLSKAGKSRVITLMRVGINS